MAGILGKASVRDWGFEIALYLGWYFEHLTGWYFEWTHRHTNKLILLISRIRIVDMHLVLSGFSPSIL